MEPATMAILGSGLASAFGNVYSNTLNAANAAKINQKNLDLQAAINLDNIEAARLNNVTAVDLANTAHQREVRDLRDAGLNPILSATGGNGASVPSLHTPDLGTTNLDRVDIVNPLSQIASAVGQAMQFEDQHKLSSLQAQILDGSLPTDVSVLKRASDAEAEASIAQANCARTQAAFDTADARFAEKMIRMKERIIDQTALKHAGLPHDENYVVDDLAGLIRDAFVSELKDKGNMNWRNNTRTVVDAINGAGSAATAIKGVRKPVSVGRQTILPNGKTITTKELFK